jgi:hypothetical protein
MTQIHQGGPLLSKYQLIQQLKNQAAGDYATFDTATAFKEQMTTTFLNHLTPGSTLQQSMAKNHQSQTEIFKFMQGKTRLENNPLKPIFETHFDGLPQPAHLHLSYLGTLDHSVDVVFTKNDHRMFATVCNRGSRGDHAIFETYLVDETGDTSKAASLIERVHWTEKQGGNIDAFYECFGEKLTEEELKTYGFKIPPITKDQKVGNCVRTSMSAAQKWLANEHGCMDAHKQVKPTLLQALLSDVTKLSQQLGRAPRGSKVIEQRKTLTLPNAMLNQITDSLERIKTIPNLPKSPNTQCLLADLLDAVAFFKEELTKSLSMETPIEESEELIEIGNNLLLELARLSEDHRRAIDEMLGNDPAPLPKPPINNSSGGDALPDNRDQ